jgi:formylglycine-generating enzyme required for sulfatase activity
MLCMFRKFISFLGFFFIASAILHAVPPILNYAGQVRVAGQPFFGTGYVKFAFVNSSGSLTYWSNDGTSSAGSEPSGSIAVDVRGGLYSILLGNTAIPGMDAIDPILFQQHSDIYIRVWFNDGERGFQHLQPDRPFSSVPYALSAGSAGIAPGSVSLNMLGSDVQTTLSATIDRSRLSADVQADLNRTIGEDQLSAQVTDKLNRDFTIQPGSIGKTLLATDVLNDLNRTISLDDLDPHVIADLNDSVADGSISYAQLTEQVRADLNRTVVLADLSPQVFVEINATIGLDRLSAEVTSLLNRTITFNDLDPQVVADLNDSVADGSITTNQLNEQILKYLRPEISQNPELAKDREQVYTGQTITLSSNAEGKFLSYQWLKNGESVAGATNREFTITDANGSLHNGNYTVQVSNDFGSVSSEALQIDVNDTQLIHPIDLNSTVDLEMIWVEPGTFSMGQDGVATPVHEVTLTNGFYLGKYEVTQAQYEAVMTGNSDGLSATPSNFASNPNRPVEKVSWDDVQKFLTRLNAQEAGNIPAGWAYVLPTEAQWEYACRAGTTTAYSWGDTITSEDANYNQTIGQTTDVGQYSANPWGFFDMHGNVWEWTSDWYEAYSSGTVTNPEGSATGSNRVFRGGSWSNTGSILRSAFRNNNHPGLRGNDIGFRVGFQQIPADVASPEMQIFGDANITHFKDTAWVDPGVEAHDVRDGNITSDIVVTGSVDVNTTGTYTLTYTVSDAAGNEASITRTVNVGIPANYATDLNSSVNLEMIWVEPGTFTRGQSDISNASPEHEVTLTNGFYLGKYEVTQAQYEAVMTGNTETDSNGNVISATPSEYSGNPDRPVEKVSWDDIQVFLSRLNAQEAGNIPEGWAYVLPTEAQWEYACRAGTTTAYSWGDSITTSDANYNNSIGQTTDVGEYSANPWGFFDMHGNVWEWTADAWGTYASGAQTDPFNAVATGTRAYRGGSWITSGASLRSAYRNGINPSSRLTMGFRVGFQQQ